jgi:hypothetical protein
LLIDLDSGRAPRPSLIATAGARALEERLVAHLPEAAVASRGCVCQLKVPAEQAGIEQLAAALPLVRESVGVVHVPPRLMRPVLEETRVGATAAMLRADLGEDRPLTALAVCDLMRQGLRVGVLKSSPGWLTARLAAFGALPTPDALPARLRERLLSAEDNKFLQCYDEGDEQRRERKAADRQERRPPARAERCKETARNGEGEGQDGQ